MRDARIERLRHLAIGIVRSALAVAVDQDGVEDIAADEAPKPTFSQ